jgi:hypothetical protein
VTARKQQQATLDRGGIEQMDVPTVVDDNLRSNEGGGKHKGELQTSFLGGGNGLAVGNCK